MGKLLFMLLVIAMPAAVSAQEFFVGGDIVPMYARPFRDRNERFFSPRVEALQMRLAVNDESDQLTLENWGDNRADIRSGAPMLKLGGGGAFGEQYSSSNKYDDSGDKFGAYARFGRFEAEVSGEDQRSEHGTTVHEYHKMAGGAAFAFGSDGLSFGLHANVNRMGNKDWKQVNENSAMGAAIALKNDLYELGAAADFIGRGQRKDSTNMDIPLQGPSFGVQAMIKPFSGFKAALRGGMAKLDAGDAWSGSSTYYDYKADQNELGARVEWRAEAIPVTFGLEYARFSYDPNYTVGGVFKKDDTTTEVKTAGAALRLLGERLILGVEAQDLTLRSESTSGSSVSKSESGGKVVAAGGELWILPGFAARASVQKMMDDDSSSGDSTTLAAGVGVKGGSFALDATARRTTMDQNTSNSDSHTGLDLALSFRF